ncbi:hypothetical protein B0J18DRAFT_484792 [Chaetomium sp. MPI-SDFR-AT-0129]|nr:hypothetical protein B0J18DRAFT_484792 [Chaetomium sp. MPI-SDFR-AT-0129]
MTGSIPFNTFAMPFYSAPPPARPFRDDKVTLLTSWWITAMCATVIILRLVGRFLRVERLFREDKIAALVLVPLVLRMALIHPVLLSGTNNVLVDEAHPLTEDEVYRRSVASRLVLVTRVLQPAILWLFKEVTVAFFDRLVRPSGSNCFTHLLLFTRISLALTFLAVLISTLTECQPFSHYYQVLPDPGPQCRQGYIYLTTLTVCNVFTDLLLVVFPIPIVIRSRLSRPRKALLAGLFALHLLTVAVALYRAVEIVREGGYQGTRTTWASVEVLVATFAANALTLGTFVRDKGVKKRKFRYRGGEAGGNAGLMVMEGSGARSVTAAGGGLGVGGHGRTGSAGGSGSASASTGRTSRGTNKHQMLAAEWDGEDDLWSDEEAVMPKPTVESRDGVKHSQGDQNNNHNHLAAPRTDAREGAVSRTESFDLLIPRSRFNINIDTNSINVNTNNNYSISPTLTPSPISNPPPTPISPVPDPNPTGRDSRGGLGPPDTDQASKRGPLLQPAEGVVQADIRGHTRGSSVALRPLERLPGSGTVSGSGS